MNPDQLRKLEILARADRLNLAAISHLKKNQIKFSYLNRELV
jgi:hypothetical protein